MERDEERRKDEGRREDSVRQMILQDYFIVFFLWMDEEREREGGREMSLVVWVILTSMELFQGCITNYSGPPTARDRRWIIRPGGDV